LSEAIARPHRLRRALLWGAAILLLLPVALVGLVLLAANTGFGRGLIEQQAGSLSGGQVVLRGLSGRFPDALRLAHLEVRDARGVWLSLDGVVLDWAPSALLGRVADIGTLSAERLTMPRLPVATPAAKPAPPSQGGFSLPVTVHVRALSVARAELGAAVAGSPAALGLTGSGSFRSLDDAGAKLAVARLDGPGSYTLDALIDAAGIRASVDAGEPQGGLAASLAKLPALGALALHAAIVGPRTAEVLALNLSAGALHATAHGTIDLPGRSAAVDLEAGAPAMSPRPDVSWSSLAVTAHVHGPFTRPDVAAHAELHDVAGGGARVARLVLDAGGNSGTVDAHAVAEGLVLPPPQPGLFTAAPLDLTVHARLDQPNMPIHLVVRHPLLATEADIQAGGDLQAKLHVVLPDLAPFASIGKADIQGDTEAVASLARHNGVSDVAVDGTAHFTGGQAPLPTALGTTTFGATARLDGQDLTISRAMVDGRTAHLDATGTDLDGKLALAWHVVLSDLAALTPQAAGRLEATGRADTAQDGIAVTAQLNGDVGGRAVKRGPLTATVKATGLPTHPAGTVLAEGVLDGAKLKLDAEVARQADGGLHATLRRADWKSLAASADLVLAQGATLPAGTVAARMTRLADLSALMGQSLAGSLTARVDLPAGPTPDARVDLQASGLAAGLNGAARLSLTGHVRDPAGDADAALHLAASGISAAGVTGQAQVDLAGPRTALGLRIAAALEVQGQPATVAAAARVDAKARTVLLSALSADYRGEQLRLRAPAKVSFGAMTGVDRLALALGPAGAVPATVEVAGRVAPDLALTAALRHVTPALAEPFAPQLHLAGEMAGDATLTGTTAAPRGTIRLRATGVRPTSGQFGFLAPGQATASLVLAGPSGRLDALASAGPKLSASLAGTVPLQSTGALALHLTLANDLSLLDPILGATGQRAAGHLAADAAVSGTAAAPRIAGRVTLAGGEIQDYVQGVRLSAIEAQLVATGDVLRIERFTAKAGPGTLGASGTIGILQPGLPVDIRLTADHARPLSSDLLTATLDADLSVRGQASTALAATGRIFVRDARINIPNALPPSVAVLHVRRPGDKPPPAVQKPAVETSLALEVDAPSQIFVRGHGLDSELGGKLTIGGTTAAPQIGGGFRMRRGTISVAGTTLNFSHGEVGFDGTSVTNKIDPTLNFVADSTSGGVTATLTVGGYADAPTIKLSSSPDLPQDEVLAHLLFGTSVKDLSAIQIAEIASALAELTGVTESGSDPIGAVRRGLGLDRLSVGGAAGSGTGATIEAGRYVARGVYVGAKQATSGGGTAAEVQIDITRRLKAKAQLATGGGTVQGATPESDPGSTVGLSYQFEY